MIVVDWVILVKLSFVLLFGVKVFKNYRQKQFGCKGLWIIKSFLFDIFIKNCEVNVIDYNIVYDIKERRSFIC